MDSRSSDEVGESALRLFEDDAESPDVSVMGADGVELPVCSTLNEEGGTS